MSYLEGTIVSQANTPRSYIVEAQGHRYRHNRQHIKPMNTDPPLPLARSYMHTAHQLHNNPIISGPQESTLTIPNTHTTPQIHNNPIISGPKNISGPPQLHPATRNVWNMKMPTLNDAPHRPSIKSHKSTHQNCPYTRPHLTKPSNYPHKPISGPPPQNILCPHKVLMQLISLNGIA